MLRHLAVLFALSLCVACGGRIRPVGPPSTGTVTADPQVLRAAVGDAVSRLRMTIVQDEGNAYVVQWGDARRRGFRFRVAFESPGYTVTLVDSVNMRQQIDPRSGQLVISGRYHKYIRRLHQYIARNLGAQGISSGVTGATENERTIQTGQPVDFGLVQRGLLVAGLQIDQMNAAAGVATTAYTDTGFGYGFIDGESATVHVAYTVTLYPTQVRIVQQAQKCAVVWVAAGYDNVQQLRCEAMPGSAPGGVLSHLDEVHATMEREIRAMLPQQQPAPQQVQQPQPGVQPGVQPAPEAPGQMEPEEDPVFVM